MKSRLIVIPALALACHGQIMQAQTEERGVADFDLTLNIDFHDTLNTNGKGNSPGIGDSDHYPVELLERIIRLAAENGFTSINFRVDYVGWVGINGSPGRDKPVHHKLFMRTLQAYDPLRAAIDISHKYGLRCYAWLTPLDNAGREPRWQGKKHLHQSTFSFEHPEYHLCNRDGTSRFGVYCFGYPEVREYMLSHLRSVLKYKPDGVFFSNRTHANFGPGGHRSEYGFNAPTIAGYQRLYRADPRDQEAYDLRRFSAVLGGFYTQLLREAAAEIHAAGVPCLAAVSWQANGRIAPRLGALDKCFFQWQTWVNEGLVDTLVMGGDAATSYDSPEHILGYMNVTADSAIPAFCRKQFTRQARVVRWLTLHRWCWKSSDELTGGPSNSFKGDVAVRMLEKLVDLGTDGAFMHEADNINIDDQWAPYRQFMQRDKSDNTAGHEK